MPHERATRQQGKAGRATHLAPSGRISLEHEPIPKSVSRVLDAARIRREYRKKKRQPDGASNSDEDNRERKKRCTDVNDDDGERSALKIKLGETVAQFNRRVEDRMMPLIKTAVRQCSAQTRRVRREEAAQGTGKRGKGCHGSHAVSEGSKKGSDPPAATIGDEMTDPRDGTKGFQAVSTCVPRRLNDIAQEPPVIKKLPRGATKTNGATSGVLSMAQKAMMEEERDRAIRHYRELKARKLRESGGSKLYG